jgi:small redox-active disulfide protein 2
LPIDTNSFVANNGNIDTIKEPHPMTIQILGTGCAKCNLLESNAREAVADSGLNIEVVKISDLDTIADMGVMMTPALAIDGEVKAMGKVLNKAQIIALLQQPSLGKA